MPAAKEPTTKELLEKINALQKQLDEATKPTQKQQNREARRRLTPASEYRLVDDKGQPTTKKFRILEGKHWQKENVDGKLVQRKYCAAYYWETGKIARVDTDGDIIESSTDLAKRFNRPGLPPRFEEVE